VLLVGTGRAGRDRPQARGGSHGRSWQRQYELPRLHEKEWIADSMTAIEQATGTRRAGYNNYRIRPGVNTLEILQELGFTYHIDDLSADEPFLQSINGQPFATVPYTVHFNDIAAKLPRLQPGRLRAADDRRVRPAVRRGRHPAPGDGHVRGSGSTFRGDMTGSGPGSWRVHLGE
jgi:peptidoglycan/xylan/chitin deacetylase (PgdA/CDA1 family)